MIFVVGVIGGGYNLEHVWGMSGDHHGFSTTAGINQNSSTEVRRVSMFNPLGIVPGNGNTREGGLCNCVLLYDNGNN